MLLRIFFVAVMAISLWNIARYFYDGWKSAQYSENLQDLVLIMETEETTTPTDAAQEKDPPSETAESPRAEQPTIPVAVDFDSLQKISGDAVAWLYCPDTELNYVVAQGWDNTRYLHRLLDGSYANGGTLFVDSENSRDFSDWNTVIYGHNMKNGTMFATLVKYREQAFYDQHPQLYLYVPGHRYTLELVAGFTTDTNDRIYRIPATFDDREKILDYARKHSTFVSDTQVGLEDKLVTLSTCVYEFENARYVLIGRILEESSIK